MNKKDLLALRNAIIAADNAIKTAKHLLASISGDKDGLDLTANLDGLSHYKNGDSQIVEGIFTGESMLGPDGHTYPVPQNYASKSQLVQGSKLKAIIHSDGKMVYKIIEEMPYENSIGVITKAGDKFQITTDKKTYSVLSAAITFHKGNIGDAVNIRIPKGKEATYAVIENIIPKP